VTAVSVRTAPAAITLRPGASEAVDLTVQNTGNQAITGAALSMAASPGLTVSALPASVSVAVGETATIRVTVTAASTAVYNAGLAVAFRALSSTWILPVGIGTDAGNCAVQAGAEAAAAGRSGLSTVLTELARRLNTLAGTPDDAALRASTIAALNNVIGQLNTPPLTDRRPAFEAAREALRTASAGAVLAAINSLGVELCTLNTALAELPGDSFAAFLSPTSQIALPGAAISYGIGVGNSSARTRTFRLTTTPLPAGVTAAFSSPTFTLRPGFFSNSPQPGFTPTSLTLNVAGPLAPFAFEVLVTAVDDPSRPVRLAAAVTTRPELVAVDTVTPSPAATAAGGLINLTARVLNVSNQARTTQLFYTVYNAANQIVRFNVFAGELELGIGSALQTINVSPPINTTGLPDGPYRLELGIFESTLRLNPEPGRANFWVGSPLSATITLAPNTLAPPAGSTTATLQLNRETAANPLATLLGSVQTTGRPQNMAILNNIVYVCGDTAISAVDVSNPANLVVQRTFGQAQLGTVGYGGTPCNIANNHLFVLYSRLNGNQSAAFLPTNIAVYNLADPINPAFVTVKQIERQDAGTLAVNGNTGTTTTQGIFFNPFSQFIFQYHGQVITLDLSDPANPREVGALFAPVLSDPRLGSGNPAAQTLPIDNTFTYVASSTMSTDPATGVGRVVIANLSNPAAPAVVSTLQIPGTRLVYSMARLGNTVLVLGDTLGNYDALSGFIGFLTLTALDITNPAAPVIRQTVTTQLRDKDAASVLALANSTFVVGGATLNDKPTLLLVDAANPAALRYVPYDTPVAVYPVRNAGSFFYTLSSLGLSTYRLDTVAGPQLTVRVEVPKATGVTVAPGTFSVAPTNVIPATDFDTYEWVQPAANTISWNLNLTGLQVGSVKQVIRGGRVDFTLPTFGPGTFALPPVTVMTDQILAMAPAERIGNAGVASTFAVTLRNPLPTPQTFNLSVSGLNPAWVSLPPAVTVGANATVNFNLVVTPDLKVFPFSRYQFVLTAQTAGGILGSVAGQMFVVSSGAAGGNSPAWIVALNAALLPPNVMIGRSGQATTTLRLENTGNVNLGISMGLLVPSSYGATFSRNDFTVRPGPENVEEVTITFNAGPNAAAGPFRVFANNLDITGTLTVLPQGVTLALTPGAGLTTTAFAATVTNTGTAAATFDLAAAGALGPVVTVTPNTVTLAPGASANVALAVGNAAVLIPGATSFDLIATSRANAAARARARATVNVPGVKGVLAALDPSPAATALTLSVNNTGNGDDEYSVRVSGTTGTAAATLRDLATNQPVAAIARMTLQGLGLGQLPVAASGAGTITITVQSLSDPAIQSVATATVGSPVVEPPPVEPPPVVPPPVTPNQAPVSRAGANRDVPIRRVATLDGRASADPDSRPQPLTHAWTLLSKPNASQLATAGIVNAGQALASFTPDAFGEYTFRLTVSDGALAGTSEVVIRCVNQLPVADAGPDAKTLVNRTVILQGDQSFDPDSDRISYAWRLLSAPAGSAVTTVRNSWTVQPYFIPDRPGTFRFSLTVRDGLAESAPDLFEVQVYETNPPASPTRTAATRSVFPAPIMGPAAAAPVVWRIVSVARDSRLNEADVNNGRFVPDVPGFYVLRREGESSATNFVFASAAACDTDADGTVNELDLQLLIGLFGSATAPEVLACSAPPPVTVPERPYFNVEPRLIQLTWQRGTPVPEPRTVFLDGDVAEYRVTVVGRGFIVPTPAQGSLPTNDRVALRFAPGSLAPGIYEDQVVFVPSGGAESVIVRVLLTVIDTPQLLVDQRPMVFRYRRGGTLPTAQTLYVTATAKPIRFEAAVATGAWLMVNPGLAQIPANLRVEVDPRTLAPGTYSGLIRVTAAEAANSPKEVPVTLIVE
jgi:large repetitive protein